MLREPTRVTLSRGLALCVRSGGVRARGNEVAASVRVECDARIEARLPANRHENRTKDG